MIRRISLFLILYSVIISLGYSQSDVSGRDELNAIRTAVPFLTIAPDSRGGAIGDAGVATSPDLSSQYWNASKYPFLKQDFGIALSYTPWLRNLGVSDLNLLYLAGYKKIDSKQTISGGLRYFNLGEIVEIDENGTATGQTIRPNEFAVDVGYTRLFSENFSGGMVFRYIRSDIAGGTSGLGSGGGARYEPGNSYAVDISTYYQKSIQLGDYDGEMAYGIDISNIGSKMSYSQDKEKLFIPTNLRLGGRLTVEIDEYNSISATLDMNKLLVPTTPERDTAGNVIAGKDDKVGVPQGMLQSFYDAPGGFEEEIREIMWSAGAEYWYREQFGIRAGYFHEHETKGNRKYFTAGVGLKLNVFSLDFSYLFPATGGRNNPLANTMRFTLGFLFE